MSDYWHTRCTPEEAAAYRRGHADAANHIRRLTHANTRLSAALTIIRHTGDRDSQILAKRALIAARNMVDAS